MGRRVPLKLALIVLSPFAIVSLTSCTGGADRDAEAKHTPVILAQENILAVSGEDTVLWNGQAVTLDELRTLLKRTTEMPVEPQLRFEPEIGASFELSAKVLQVVKESGVTKFGFVGNEKHPAD